MATTASLILLQFLMEFHFRVYLLIFQGCSYLSFDFFLAGEEVEVSDEVSDL